MVVERTVLAREHAAQTLTPTAQESTTPEHTAQILIPTAPEHTAPPDSSPHITHQPSILRLCIDARLQSPRTSSTHSSAALALVSTPPDQHSALATHIPANLAATGPRPAQASHTPAPLVRVAKKGRRRSRSRDVVSPRLIATPS